MDTTFDEHSGITFGFDNETMTVGAAMVGEKTKLKEPPSPSIFRRYRKEMDTKKRYVNELLKGD